jgi:hypothetical protein
MDISFPMNQEEAHRPTLPAATEEVRDFYEPYPYSRAIDSKEKYLLDAIDGNCCIAAMMAKLLPSSQEKSLFDVVSNFFEWL